jgi:hypothetical protein
MKSFPIICPRCKQGPDLHRVRVMGLNDLIFVCHECDATWLSSESIGQVRALDFEKYLREQGLDPILAKQEILD